MTNNVPGTGIGARLLQRGFGRPSGVLGRIGGLMMAHGNAATEHHLVQLAEPRPDDTVVVLGPGPGVGVEAAAGSAGHVVGIDPSELMLTRCARRCAKLLELGRVQLRRGTAEHTGLPDESADVVVAVNNAQLWPDWAAAFTEVHRILRPNGRVLVSTHHKWLPGGLDALEAAVERAGFDNLQSWTWEPPSRGASTAAQLSARRTAGA